MFSKIQLFLACIVWRANALHHHQSGAAYQGPGYGGYFGPAAGSPYRGYADYAGPPQPYNSGYDTMDEFGNRQYRSEQGDANNVKTGSYGYMDVYGLYRRVNYVADANGFRATVDTNEPGTAPGASADVVFNAAPIVPPVPAGAAVSAGYGARAAVPGYTNGYGGYGAYGYGQNVAAAGTYGNGGYGRSGYAPYGQGLGGSGYAGYGRPSGYGAGYGAGYGVGRYGPANYGGWAAGHHGYRRR